MPSKVKGPGLLFVARNYRLYNSAMNLWQAIVGHEWAVEVLRSAIAHDRLGHAYLITGPAQVGKGTLARTFAQALNCTAPAPDDRPCGHCRPCKLIAAGRHPDVKIVIGESSGRARPTIKIDQIRELQAELSLTAAEARYKVAILEHFETATVGASNAFLKTLEEPAGNTVLILTASDVSTFVPAAIAQRPGQQGVAGALWDVADIVLPTISSRCRTIGLRPLAASLVESALIERWGVEPARARILAHLADGRIGRAVALAQTPSLLEERAAQLALLFETFEGTRVERFAAADRLAGSAEELPGLLQTWLSFWRDLLLVATSGDTDGAISNVDQAERLKDYTQSWAAEVILFCLHHTEAALWQLQRNANSRLVLENLLLSYPQLALA